MQNEEIKPARSVKSFFHSSFIIHHSAFVLIALLALAIRLPQLGERPMHTDEAVNAYITGQLLTGEAYRYDPQDRHGPVLYLLAKPFAQLCGATNFSSLTEIQLRLTPVIIGSAMILLFAAAVEMFGLVQCLVAALLFAVAPLPVYYSRYFIHETLFVAATLALILSGWRAVKFKSPFYAALAGLCAALMLACKETAVLHFFAIGCAALGGWLWNSRTRLRHDKSQAVDAAKISPASPRPWSLTKIAATGFLAFIIATILLFTSFGQNWSALADLFHAIPRFAARAGGEGHEKPFWYYFQVLGAGWSGAVMLALALIGWLLLFRHSPSSAKFSIAVYAPLIVVIYSLIPYKTPWLALNLWLPVALFAGFAVKFALKKIQSVPASKPLLFGFVAGCAAWLFVIVHDTHRYVFKDSADEKNPYAYAHTGEDLLRLPERISELSRQKNLASPRIAVVAADAWPLPWYLRKFSNAGFWQPDQEPGPADFFITPADISGKLAAQLKDFRPEFFGARPNVLLILWTPNAAPASP